jgi:hypothetical protein
MPVPNIGPEAAVALARAIERRIAERTWRRIRQLEVEVREGRIIVHGCTASYYVKQLALAAVRDVTDAAPVELDIQVVDAESLQRLTPPARPLHSH